MSPELPRVAMESTDFPTIRMYQTACYIGTIIQRPICRAIETTKLSANRNDQTVCKWLFDKRVVTSVNLKYIARILPLLLLNTQRRSNITGLSTLTFPVELLVYDRLKIMLSIEKRCVICKSVQFLQTQYGDLNPCEVIAKRFVTLEFIPKFCT